MIQCPPGHMKSDRYSVGIVSGLMVSTFTVSVRFVSAFALADRLFARLGCFANYLIFLNPSINSLPTYS